MPLAVDVKLSIAPSHRSREIARDVYGERQEIAQGNEPNRAGLEAESTIGGAHHSKASQQCNGEHPKGQPAQSGEDSGQGRERDRVGYERSQITPGCDTP